MFLLTSLASLGASAAPQDFASVARPFLDQHCVRCHKDSSAESKFMDLASPTSVLVSDPSAAERDGQPDWEWLLEQVKFGDMPPPGEAAPTDLEREAFVAWLGAELGQDGGTLLSPLPAGGLRRLTAFEYQNAVLDILGVSLDLTAVLPEDAVGHGFDHVASAQSLSEAHFLRYLEAAELVAEAALPLALLDGEPRVARFFPEALSGGRAQRQARWLWSNGEVRTTNPLPAGGLYRIRAEVYGEQAGPDPCRAQLFLGGATSEQLIDVAATQEAPEVIETEVYASGDEELVAGVRFVNDYYRKPDEEKGKQDRNFAVRWVEVEGPLDGGEPTLFMETWGFAGEPVRKLEESVAQCAELLWRRPAQSHEAQLKSLLELSPANETDGHRMRAALVGMLASPRFLFYTETSIEAGEVSPRGGVEVDAATFLTRAVSFLWRSIPDRELWEDAGADGLPDAKELVRQLLAHPRSDRFARSFVDQWLQLRSTESKRPDRKVFPDVDERLRRSMLEETRRVFVESLRERRSLWELVDGTETVVNRRLAKHYGLTAEAFGSAVGGEGKLPRGDEWLRASLLGTARRGLLGHGAILFGTSEATRTSPVSRGRWVLDVLLGSAPPPPPPGADNLAPLKKGAAALSLRERMDLHRADATCAACHARMDPIGFGLERFDGVGFERSDADPAASDLSGKLPDGRSFDGPVELAAVLRGEQRFLEALVERLLVFALGRGLEREDRGAVQKVLATLDPSHPTLEDMILGVVQLEEFASMIPAQPMESDTANGEPK